MSDMILYAAFPYVAVVLAIWGGVHRYRHDRFSYSTLSSQLLENRTLFWGSVPWHYGIVIVLLAHLLGFLVPGMWARMTGTPRSEEHTSELQSQSNLVCRLLLEKKKKKRLPRLSKEKLLTINITSLLLHVI